MNEIRIDFEACSGCKTCYKACFVDVFRWDQEAKRPIVAYPEDCAECNMCEVSCPEECIAVIVDWGKYYPPFFERSVGEMPVTAAGTGNSPAGNTVDP